MSDFDIPNIHDLQEVKDTLDLKSTFARYTYPTNN